MVATVTARAEDGTTTVEYASTPGPTIVYQRDQDLNILRRGGVRYAPCERLFDFPLAVGKSWSARFQAFDGSSVRAIDHDLSARVAAIEEVDVPAGHYTAFRVEVHDLWTPHVTDFQVGIASFARTNVVYWYAPPATPGA
ncbi:hypothetical protein WN982_24810 [Paraburkholderia sp. IMGN_8]|uniref:hypothetical protein n=1 Tax=Paraburkholderia sp. IMGN_8 TaxID=3136564 RepID=UPI003101879D